MSALPASSSMYSHCVHCAANLGSNDVLEAFPVGKRVAFDSDKGRLWVVCAKCERWNLAPFESRWEAIEQAERAYRSTSVRMATDNIGLAKWRDGTTLVRIGRPLRPEFAAWRYGDQFGRRRRRALLTGTAVTAGGAAALSGAIAAGASLALLLPMLQAVNLIWLSKHQRASVSALRHPDGKWFVPWGDPRLIAGTNGPDNWAVEIGWFRRLDEPRAKYKEFMPSASNMEHGRVVLTGALARDALARTLVRVNSAGATVSRVREAVSLIENAGGPDSMLAWAVTQRSAWAAQQNFGDTGDFRYIPKPARLAIEMAVHEDRERLALQGELSELERAWQDAERIAGIADSLLIPAKVDDALADIRHSAGRERKP